MWSIRLWLVVGLTAAAALAPSTGASDRDRDLALPAGAGPAVVRGGDGNDTLKVDFSEPVPADVLFDGGGQRGAPGDALAVAGVETSRVTVTHLPDSPGGGHNGIVTVVPKGRRASRIEYRDLEPVTMGQTADLVINVPVDAADNQAILEDDGTTGNGMSRLRSGNSTFEQITFAHPTSTLTINLGDDATEGLTVTAHEVPVPVNVNGGSGQNALTLDDGPGLNSGVFEGGSGTDGIDYTPTTTASSVNLGSNAPGLDATLGPDQEVPATTSSGSGTATATYDPAAKTVDITVTVSGIAPAAVTGFHIHRAAVGVNGPIIIDFGAGPLTPVGDGFTFSGNDIPVPAQHEAALLGGLTYVNVHTAAFASGAIRGQLFPNALLTAVPGTATDTGGISNVENATGGSSADSLMGSLGVNVLTGGGGNDTIVPSRGNDFAGGSAGVDNLVWSNGDGTDILDGNSDADHVQVNGSPTADDVFTLGPGPGGRVAFARTSPAPFSLDIGTVETLAVAGIGGNDALTVSPLTGVIDLGLAELHGLAGNDVLDARGVAPAAARMRGGTGTDSLTGPSATWNLTGVGTGSGSPGVTELSSVENLTGDTGADTFNVAAGAGLLGTLDGGTGTDTLNYSALTQPVTVNLGTNTPSLSGTLGSDQEVPATTSAGTGTGTLVYDPATRTADVNVTVSGIAPADVTGFHIHRAAIGVNGPIIIDFGAGPLTPAGDGFTFAANDVPVPAADEAALLGGQTYLNVHTPSFPNGAIRGQLFADNLFVAAGGTATGFGGLAGVENATGGAGADSLLGNGDANVLTGGPGADVLVGARGNDTMTGGDAGDVMVWSNGDGTDVMDGQTGGDLVQVNGSPSADDVFAVAPGAGGRLAFNRISPAPFGIDIGTVETLAVAGIGGNDSLTAQNLSGVAELGGLHFHGLAGNETVFSDGGVPLIVTGGLGGDALNLFGGFSNDTFTVTPATGGRVAVDGGGHAANAGSTEQLAVDGADGNDTFNVGGLGGVSGLNGLTLRGAGGDDIFNVTPAEAIGIGVEGGAAADALRVDPACATPTIEAGKITVAGRQPVTHVDVESVDVNSAFWLAASAWTVGESAGPLGIEVRRSGTGTATVQYATVAGTASPGADFTPISGSLTFAPGETAKPLSIPILGDAADEADETFTLTLSGPGAQSVLCDPVTGTATITDDDVLAPGRFRIQGITINRRTGTATLRLLLPSRGNVSAKAVAEVPRSSQAGARRVTVASGRRRNVGPGSARLTIRPNRAGRRLLRARGRLRVRITATLRPASGARATARRNATLRLRRPR